jgi:crotonobetainyl-CoA:carnitine CoA-transferase CaiB-like acyl-CoA transferase
LHFLIEPRTGKGQLCDISMMDGALSLLAYTFGEWSGNDKLPLPGREFLTGGFAMYNIYKCKDGSYVSLGAIEQKFWMDFVQTERERISFLYNIFRKNRIMLLKSLVVYFWRKQGMSGLPFLKGMIFALRQCFALMRFLCKSRLQLGR